MKPYYETQDGRLYHGDSLEVLKRLPDQSVNCCVTSPPYWGLRDYGTAEWIGGDIECKHVDDGKLGERLRQQKSMIACGERCDGSTRTRVHDEQIGKTSQYLKVCKKCGATRKDRQIGLEETPEAFVEKLVAVFEEVRRVLRDDGTCWVNLGDSYSTHPPTNNNPGNEQKIGKTGDESRKTAMSRTGKQKKGGLPEKNLIGIPWRVAFALQSAGWYLRQDIIWHKPNPMPESVKDRCTKAHEYIFLLSKSQKYFCDMDAVKEDAQNWGTRDRTNFRGGTTDPKLKHHGLKGSREESQSRNKRSVWTCSTKPFSGAHFAVFPPDLIEPCIMAGCPKGGTVIDPFMGSGTTAIVSHKHDRKFIGIELNQKYLDEITIPRVSAATAQMKLF